MQDVACLTVKDILKRKYFDNAEVIAGKSGLMRKVKWVHVVEVPKIQQLLNGQELILSTGVGWKEDEQLFLHFLNDLILSQASGLCIEMGTYTTTIPSSVLSLANQHHFPIIVFREEVPFVNITQDIHTYIINQQYSILQKLEAYSQQLNARLLSVHHFKEILGLLHYYTGYHVVLMLANNEVYVLPDGQEDIINDLEQKSGHIAMKEIYVMNKPYGTLYIMAQKKEISEVDVLILNRTATALAQHFLREMFVEEKKRGKQSEWIRSWLEGVDSIKGEQLIHSYFKKGIKGGVVCFVRTKEVEGYHDGTYFHLFARSIFEQLGFHFLAAEHAGDHIFVLFNQREHHHWKERVQRGLEKIMKMPETYKRNIHILTIGIGKYAHQLSDFPTSFQTAKEAIRIYRNIRQTSDLCFYDELHMYRIIGLLQQSTNLQEIIAEYLQPLIDYDRKHHGKLLETLKVFLQCNCSKKETAKKLYVVRQTLYHRLSKIEQLLGKDFLHSDKRIAIELMLYAHDFLQQEQTAQSSISID
jgi:PucR family transcriptional regulator, purine catabolism regulatory protein